MSDAYDPLANGLGCFNLGIRAWREACIRKGMMKPRQGHEDELRWAAEGWPEHWHDHSHLDSVRNG